MPLVLSHTTWDAHDPHTIAEFWRELLGWEIAEPDCYHPGSDECYLASPDGHTILFLEVPDAKRVKNRAHMDLRPAAGSTRDDEIDRAVSLGATIVADHRDDLSWAVMADPEGNEFCILKTSASA
ncbi:VOC family protein [Gulosibacter faecalis]|uniref:VOC family protein n=1 Tax=Gulosibacter faecalis TaxID=272240 RepID=A0ABW5UYC1_9MICO|nr:VOC family protein [Gulosibacter faecalis]